MTLQRATLGLVSLLRSLVSRLVPPRAEEGGPGGAIG
jgi:hypothetical protein